MEQTAKVDQINKWILGARIKTLPAALIPVTVGTAIAYKEQAEINFIFALSALMVSVSLQVATNYVNDYADGQRGTDDDRVGPTRLVASGLATASQVKLAALISFAVAGVFGAYLGVFVGPELLVVGALSILAGWAYTAGPKPYAYLGLGELFVFVFFGLVATVGSSYVQTQQITIFSILSGVVVGGLSVALMVTNNLRDIEGDKLNSKNTLAVKMGDQNTRYFYVTVIVASLLACAAISFKYFPVLVSLLFFQFYIKPIREVLGGARGVELIKVLEYSARAQLLVGIALTMGLLL